MRTVLTIAIALLMASCATIEDSSVLAELSPQEIQRRKDHPVEAEVYVKTFELQVSAAKAYAQFQRNARRCWQVAGSISLEDDPLTESRGYARLAMRFGNPIRAVVTIRPAGPDAASIDMRTVLNQDYLDHIRTWFNEGVSPDCFPPTNESRPDPSRQRY